MSKKNKTDSDQQTQGAKGGNAANPLGKMLDQLNADYAKGTPFLSIFGHGRRQGETQAAKLISDAHKQHLRDQEQKGAFKGGHVDPEREKPEPEGILIRGYGAKIDREAENSPVSTSSETFQLPLPRSRGLTASDDLFLSAVRGGRTELKIYDNGRFETPSPISPVRETEIPEEMNTAVELSRQLFLEENATEFSPGAIRAREQLRGAVQEMMDEELRQAIAGETTTVPETPKPGKAERKAKAIPSRFWRYRWAKVGGHIHVTVFVSTHPKQTYANCGELVMSTRDWNSFRDNLSKTPGVEILEAE